MFSADHINLDLVIEMCKIFLYGYNFGLVNEIMCVCTYIGMYNKSCKLC